MTTVEKIRALAEARFRDETEQLLDGHCVQARILSDDGSVIVAKGDNLNETILRRLPVELHERLQILDHRVQDAVFAALDEYHEVINFVDFTDLKGRLSSIATSIDSDITSITLNRRRKTSTNIEKSSCK